VKKSFSLYFLFPALFLNRQKKDQKKGKGTVFFKGNNQDLAKFGFFPVQENTGYLWH